VAEENGASGTLVVETSWQWIKDEAHTGRKDGGSSSSCGTQACSLGSDSSQARHSSKAQQGTASKLATQQHSGKVPARKQARLSSKAAAEVKQEAANGLQWQLQKQQSKAAPAKQKQLGVQAAWCASYGGSLLVVDITLTCGSNEAALDQTGPTRF
jgi:hypothetical protein